MDLLVRTGNRASRPRAKRPGKLVALAGAVFAFASLLPAAVRADQQTIPLSSLELLVRDAPSLQAAERRIDADLAFEGVVSARSGLEYTFSNALGPRSDIVINNLNYNTFRYQQRIGLALPILGSRIEQQNAAIAARADEAQARIDYEAERRRRLSTLRAAYVLYWQYDRQQAIAQHYVTTLTSQLEAARALRRNGFWTQGQFMDFLDTLERYKTSSVNLRNLRRAQLTQIASAIGAEMYTFTPTDPTFEAGCAPARDTALASAVQLDAEIAKADAQIAEYQAELQHVRGSAIQGSLQAGLGNTIDFVTPTVGYELNAGVSIALPTHARSEERALRTQLLAEVDQQRLLIEQRRSDLVAQIEGAIDDLSNARDDLVQARRDETAKDEDLREALVRFGTLNTPGSSAFDDVQIKSAEAYTAETATAIARGTVFTKANDLLALAPSACS